ncbi:hypothetical protein DFJ63DRAFT_87107 [Scheffersomyces coipomensis]|uniref:uncharacterized protein n=1 Tax=Scheffersomyces coipomensis TaxID=1788519 RepID=UPI00315CEC32
MVYYFKAKAEENDENQEYNDFGADIADEDDADSREYIIYMGKDKIENDPLIKHSNKKNIWFHVDNHSSAHLYLQITKDEHINFKSFDKFVINPSILQQVCQLTKANSIKGNKLNNVTVIYTPVDNLHTDGSMDIGTVTFKNAKQVKRLKITKRENAIINKLNKTKYEISIDEFKQQQVTFEKDIENERRRLEKEQEQLNKIYEKNRKDKLDPYADLFTEDNVNQSSNEYRNENWAEDDFM